jgi:integrase
MSSLPVAVKDYLALRRGLGYKLAEPARLLPQFAAFLRQHRASFITYRLVLEWVQQPPSSSQPSACACRLAIVRGFARYRSATDPRTEVPPPGLFAYRSSRARPYLYSEQEIRSLLDAALKIRDGKGLRPWTHFCLLGLLAVTGMRVGEARHLEVPDVDLKAGVLTVRNAKFGKDRLLPLHRSSCAVLQDYLLRRDRQWGSATVSPYFFVSDRGGQIPYAEIRDTFAALCRRVGLRAPADHHGPRLHDLRHRFAILTLLRWYRAGEDPERRLPSLSTYLGHADIKGTYWYLSDWPELMREAMSRLERRWEADR